MFIRKMLNFTFAVKMNKKFRAKLDCMYNLLDEVHSFCKMFKQINTKHSDGISYTKPI